MLTAAIVSFQGIAASEKSGHPDPTVNPVTTKQPEDNKVYPIAIIGAGAAGTMAVKRAVLNNNETLLFLGAKQERRRSRGNWVRKVDNMPGFSRYSRTVLELRNEALEELVQGPFSHNLFVIEDSISSIEREGGFFHLQDASGRTYYAKHVILATGIMDEQPSIQGSIRPILKYANGQTVAYCVLCDGHRSFRKQMAVIGHSGAAASNALLLAEKYPLQKMVILTNGRSPEFSPELLNRLEEKNISVFTSPIQEVLGNKEQKLLTGFKLENGSTVEADMAFVSLGVRPNNQLALQLGAKVDESGLVIADPSGETSVPNLFVIGDLRANSMKQIFTAWQHAVDTVQLINRRLREKGEGSTACPEPQRDSATLCGFK